MVLVGLFYALAAALVLGVAGWARPVLALPALFPRALRTALIGGLPVALVLAWHYPRIGHHGAAPDREGQG